MIPNFVTRKTGSYKVDIQGRHRPHPSGEAWTVTGKLHSPEHNQSFNVQNAPLQLVKESKDSDRLKRSIDGQHIIDWFEEQFTKLPQTIRPHIKPPAKPESNKSKDFKG